MVVSLVTLNQDTYAVVSALLIANKPTYTDVNGATQTYTILASYPQDKSQFPCIVIDPAEPKVALLNLDGSGEETPINVQLDFYAKAKDGNKAVDAGTDSVRNTFLTNTTSLSNNNLLLQQEPFDESNTVPFEDTNNQQLLTKSMIVGLKLQ